MLKLLISLCGIAAGVGLGYIAKEEIVLGKKYLQVLRYVLSFVILSTALFYFLQSQQWILLSVSILIWALLIILSLKWKWEILEIPFYLLFAGFYILIPLESTLIASLIFLYGLPVGSLMWQQHENNQKRSGRNH